MCVGAGQCCVRVRGSTACKLPCKCGAWFPKQGSCVLRACELCFGCFGCNIKIQGPAVVCDFGESCYVQLLGELRVRLSDCIILLKQTRTGSKGLRRVMRGRQGADCC